VAQLEIALDTAHEDGVAPFWSVLLTGSPDNKIYDSIFDPTGRVPGLWFQGAGKPRNSPPALALRPVARPEVADDAGSPQPWPPAGHRR